ncbi:hypothetical protein [Spirulina subsalsa]|uniref:hypothetical protein n=1 Tax=Spirulina subsalsa TaxID=54311 RepID=UPI000367998B|nr:hypothetical protein [Spirulina subsalsa]
MGYPVRQRFHHIPLGWDFLVDWMMATLLGYGVSLLVVEVGETSDISLFSGALGGLFVGIAQFFILRKELPQARGWLIMTALGWFVITGGGLGAIGWSIPHTNFIGFRLLYGVAYGVTTGLILGTVQWIFLRQFIPLAQWWIILNSLGWGLALAVGWLVGGGLRSLTQVFFSEIIGLGVTWLTIGGITGLAMIALLNQRIPPESRTWQLQPQKTRASTH